MLAKLHGTAAMAAATPWLAGPRQLRHLQPALDRALARVRAGDGGHRVMVVTALPSRPADVAAFVGLQPGDSQHEQVCGVGGGERGHGHMHLRKCPAQSPYACSTA